VQILYEDAVCLAVLKPTALPTQSPQGIESLESRVRELLRVRSSPHECAEENYLAVLHRLDRAAAGVVLLAKTRRAARVISRQFERRQIRKIYWACVDGIVEPAEGTWLDFMRKVPDQPRSEIVSHDHPAAQRAVLHYRVLKSDAARSGRSPVTCLEIELETGRMHQIRLQAASRGHPILGDILYGSRGAFGPPPAHERDRQIALHAREISFVQPDSREKITVVAPLPTLWSEVGLRLED
jgi:23S rRNA pseudouridine1911/1915/1917 synthase